MCLKIIFIKQFTNHRIIMLRCTKFIHAVNLWSPRSITNKPQKDNRGGEEEGRAKRTKHRSHSAWAQAPWENQDKSDWTKKVSSRRGLMRPQVGDSVGFRDATGKPPGTDCLPGNASKRSWASAVAALIFTTRAPWALEAKKHIQGKPHPGCESPPHTHCTLVATLFKAVVLKKSALGNNLNCYLLQIDLPIFFWICLLPDQFFSTCISFLTCQIFTEPLLTCLPFTLDLLFCSPLERSPWKSDNICCLHFLSDFALEFALTQLIFHKSGSLIKVTPKGPLSLLSHLTYHQHLTQLLIPCSFVWHPGPPLLPWRFLLDDLLRLSFLWFGPHLHPHFYPHSVPNSKYYHLRIRNSWSPSSSSDHSL